MFKPIDAYVFADWLGPKKFCPKCQTPKPLINFWKCRQHKDGLQYLCISCSQEYIKEYLKTYTKDRSAYHKSRWASLTVDQRQRVYAIRRQNRANNLASYRQMDKDWNQKNHDKVKAKRRRYHEKHPEVMYERNAARRARLLNAPVIEKINRQKIIERDRSICHICKKRVNSREITLDHLIPLIKGGEHTERNLAVAHRSCNSRRHDGKLPAQLRLY